MRMFKSLFICLISVLFLLSASEAATKKQTRKKIKQQRNQGQLFKGLPSNKKAVKTKRTSGASLYAMAGQYPATSGTPPTLVSLGETGIKNVFWKDGVIDEINAAGSLSQSQCNQFFGNAGDGDSGGFLACTSAQNVAQSFEIIVQGEVSMCLTRAVTTAQGGVTVSGAANVAEALTPNPDSTPKLVKIEFGSFPGGGPQPTGMFILIPGAETNQANNNLYEQTLYFCQNATNPIGRENGVIQKNLTYTTNQMFLQSGIVKYSSSVSSQLNLNQQGQIIFDPESAKTMSVNFVGLGGGFCNYNKVQMTFADKKISQKLVDNCFGAPRSSYSVLRYSGSNMGNLRFIEGGMKDSFITSITEFRDATYISAPDNQEFVADLAAVNLTEDFYNQAPNIDTTELTSFDCDRTDIDVTINVDFTNPALIQKLMSCQNATFSDLDFCRSDAEVNTAAIKAFNECSF